MVDPVINIKNLNVIYNQGKSNQIQPLTNVNLKVFPGEYVIIFGPSGCGKSTLLSSIAGLQVPTSGEVFIGGKEVSLTNKKEILNIHRYIVGMVFQAFYLLSSISILENICLPKIFCGESGRKRREIGMNLLQRFSISEQAHKYPNQLSGGQKQRVAIARALINDPQIILADEPVGNLDSESAENVMKIFKELNDVDRKTVIMVTHNSEYAYYADRVIYMRDGRIISEEINRDKRPKEALKEEILKEPEILSNELKILIRSFKNFSPNQIGGLLVPYKAKQLIAYLTTELTEEQLRIAESFLRDYLFENIDVYGFKRSLDMNIANGGAGWNRQRSDAFSERVEDILVQVKNIATDYQKALVPFADYLIKLFKIKLESSELKGRLINFLKMRIDNKLDCFSLKDRLDAPKSLGGLGLYKNTAEKMVKEIEIIMLIKYNGKEQKQ